MPYKDLRKLKPEIVDINNPQKHPLPGFKRVTRTLPAKEFKNLKGDMQILDEYLHGAWKWPDTGKTCGNCVNFYHDPKLGKKGGGRCRARGYLEVHEDLSAEDKYNYTTPDGSLFPFWPACPLYLSKERVSQR